MAAVLTFNELCVLEPRLRQLETDARAYAKAERKRWRYRCGNRPWYSLTKPRLVWLVGKLRPNQHPVLSTSLAYDTAYSHLYGLMPECRECSFM
jgi:hypothetical protein